MILEHKPVSMRHFHLPVLLCCSQFLQDLPGRLAILVPLGLRGIQALSDLPERLGRQERVA